jgi:hypothetical protein
MIININIERIYSLCKLKEYLSHYELTYKDIIERRVGKYKEESNGFCYYILVAVLLYYYEQTMNWFVETNHTLLQFKKNNDHIYLFYHYIKLIYNQKELLHDIESLNHYNFKNNFMSVFEIDI